MARRSPRNPLSDIVDAAGAWLGGNRGTVNPQVERVTRDVVRAAAAADAVTGGYGAAAVRDVRNFAQGGSLPTNLAKTAAVNAAAAAAGYGAAVGVQRGVARFAPQLMQDVGVHFSKNPKITGSIKTSRGLRGTGKGPSMGPNFEVKVDVAAGKTYKFSGYGPTLGNPTKPGEMLPASKFQDFMSAQDTAYVTRSRLGRVDVENPALYKSPKIEEWYQYGGKYQSQRMTGKQRIVETVPDYYDNKLTDAVQRARAQLAADRVTTRNVAALTAALAPKKGRGGGKNKR